MSDNKYEALFNLIMDITTCIHIPLKIFAIYVIVRHTPPQLRHYSYFTLNTMFWNFLCNFVTAFVHFYPLFPALCLRADGIASYFVNSEDLGYWLFLLMTFITAECSMALLFAFPHRYIVFVHPNLAARIRPVWVFAICGAAHVVFALFYFPIAMEWIVRYKDNPDKLFVYCLNPNVIQNVAIAYGAIAVIAMVILIIVGSSLLFLREVRKLQKEITHEETLALQKKVFANLLTLTAVAVVFGGVPMVLSVCAFVFPSQPFNREISMISMFVLCNHGGVSAIAYLVFFKAYRNAVKRIFSNPLDLLRGWKIKVRSVMVGLRDSNVSVILANVK